MSRKKHSRAKQAAIRAYGYHEVVCDNQEASAYMIGYERGFKAGQRAAKRKAPRPPSTRPAPYHLSDGNIP